MKKLVLWIKKVLRIHSPHEEWMMIPSVNHKQKWAVSPVVCNNCGNEWVAVRPAKTKDEKLVCPRCDNIGAHLREGSIYRTIEV